MERGARRIVFQGAAYTIRRDMMKYNSGMLRVLAFLGLAAGFAALTGPAAAADT